MTCNIDYYSVFKVPCQELFWVFGIIFTPPAKNIYKLRGGDSMAQILLLIFLVILLCPTTIKVSFSLEKEKFCLHIKLYLCGMVPIKRKIFSSIAVNFSLPVVQSSKKVLANHKKSLLLKSVYKSISVHHFAVNIGLFLQNRYYLAQIYALYWTFRGIFAPHMPDYLSVNFTPLFQKDNSYLALNGIFSVSLAQIILSTSQTFMKNWRN